MTDTVTDIVEQLDDLIRQATEERSHFYVRSVAEESKATITRLRAQVEELEAALGEMLNAAATFRACANAVCTAEPGDPDAYDAFEMFNEARLVQDTARHRARAALAAIRENE